MSSNLKQTIRDLDAKIKRRDNYHAQYPHLPRWGSILVPATRFDAQKAVWRGIKVQTLSSLYSDPEWLDQYQPYSGDIFRIVTNTDMNSPNYFGNFWPREKDEVLWESGITSFSGTLLKVIKHYGIVQWKYNGEKILVDRGSLKVTHREKDGELGSWFEYEVQND